MKKHSIAYFVVFTVLLLPGLLAAGTDREGAMDWQPPPFEAQTTAGDSFRYPEDLEGPTIVFFWASWCPYCKALMPHLQSIVDEYDYEVRVLAPNFREDEDPVAYLAQYGYEFLLIPQAEAIAESWGVKGTPGLFLADASGRVVFNRKAIPERAYPAERFASREELKHYQKAARVAPFWAAWLRKALDELNAGGE